MSSVAADSQCDFGKWLHGTAVTPAEKATPQYATVKTLHADFHKAAASVLQMAVTGKRADAEKAMGPTSPFAAISSKLTMALLEMKKHAS